MVINGQAVINGQGAVNSGRVINGNRAGGIVLPRWLETNNGTLLEAFDSAAAFSLINGGSVVNNAAEYITGGNAVKATTNGTTAGLRVYRTTSNWNFGGAAPTRLRLYFYCHDINLSTMSINIYTSTSPERYYSYTMLQTGRALTIGWNSVDIYPANWTANNTPNWAAGVAQVRYIIGADSGSVTTQVTLGAVYSGMENYTACLISFDDSFASDYSIAYAYMQPLGLKATTYTISANIDVAGSLTTAQLLTMQAAGWCVGSHGNTNAQLAATTAPFLQGIGITDGWKHAAYVGGTYDYDIVTTIKAAGFLTGRLANQTVVGVPYISRENANGYYIGAQQIDTTKSLATAQGYIDTAIANKQVVWLFFHRLVTSGATGNQWNEGDFQDLIDYIVTAGVPLVTPLELVQLISGPLAL